MADMRKFGITGLAVMAAMMSAQSHAQPKPPPPLRFWNTTTMSFTGVFLAPAGTTDWGLNQAKNDPDGAVDGDERLKLTNVPEGRLDVRLVDKAGHACVVHGVDVLVGKPYAFAIGNEQLSHCRQ